ncbi:c-type cytochrome [Pseudomonas xantholysinigenes]|uniref:c-type cytochrome n=1 Tax=Pseudomonas xantholysinigenes TaxID=2745490 RepID=UPI001CED68FC|nr:cytochrome c [Pseudomonas xantholysinigenes]
MARRLPWALCWVLALPAWATEPRQFDYMLNCQGCHLPDGSGNPARGVPAFPGQLGRFLSLPGGREYLVQVPGSALSGLSDEALANVLNWMLARFDPGHLPADFQAYTGAEVRRWRQAVPSDVNAIRERLLQGLAKQEQGKIDR